ncbi:Chromosome segregation protein SMC [Vibrio crassostreae]|uniref:AAA family ATPase n=1 Tax=Vibrio TaxID=662 RepID=UPI00104C1CF0|nr:MULTISPECIES: AAA family ATPase [Vibrio]MDP2590216.1 AAA family ATPase [Vibrio splendidus]TCN98692.1 putative ATP-binding protein involved in virulence [Vibrio crassostreae]CAK2394451.1 Chromosome segregation protein SMC [Vibrio crassostreae]
MNEYKSKLQRGMDEIINEADNGNILSLFLLSKLYKTGKYLEGKDLVKSDACIKSVLDSASKFKPCVSELQLFDFRGIKKGKVKLHPKMNVIVGENGSGKTTIIEAICKSCSWISSLIINEKSSGDHLDFDDINSSFDVSESNLLATFDLFNSNFFTLRLSLAKKGVSSSNKSILEEFRLLSEIYRMLNSADSQSSLPIFSYYSINRSYDIKSQCHNFKRTSKVWGKMDGYLDALNNDYDFKVFIDWLAKQEEVDAESGEFEKVTSNISEEEIKLETVKDMLKLFSDVDDEDKIKAKLLSDVREITDKIESLSKVKQEINASSTIVKNAISEFIDISNIRTVERDGYTKILLDKCSTTIEVSQLSQGEKSLFTLVGDIARRLVLLNPGVGKDALNGSGVIIIDEVDLHLHPKWQQEILTKLSIIFPNVQFIVTTHSPQILSTVKHDSIHIIENKAREFKLHHPSFSLGSEANMLLEDIFCIESRPQALEIVQFLNEYKGLVKSNDWDSDRAKELYVHLKKWAGEHDPVMTELDMDVRLRKKRMGK